MLRAIDRLHSDKLVQYIMRCAALTSVPVLNIVAAGLQLAFALISCSAARDQSESKPIVKESNCNHYTMLVDQDTAQ
jgi:hypothetical protein